MEIDYCFVSKQLNVGFVPIPKAGTTSIKKALLRIDADEVKEIHRQSLVYKVPISKARARGVFLFTFVRNPFERIVSIWYDRVAYPRDGMTRMTLPKNDLYEAGMPFSKFLYRLERLGTASDLHTLTQSSIILHKGSLNVDFIGRMERLDTDWKFLRSNFQLGEIPMLNQTNSKNAEVLTQEATAMVKRIYQKDISLLGYRHG